MHLQKQLKNYEIKTQIYTETDRKHRLMCTNYNDMHSLINKMYYSDDVICLERKRKKVSTGKDLCGHLFSLCFILKTTACNSQHPRQCL